MNRLLCGFLCAVLTACGHSDEQDAHLVGSGVDGADELFVVSPELVARQSFIAERMADAGPEYAFRRSGEHLSAVHPMLDLRTVIAEEGVRFGSRASDWVGALRVREIGRQGQTLELPLGVVHANANRVDYERTEIVTEWYLHGPLGIEQGVTIRERPRGGGPLVLDVALDGLRAVAGSETDRIFLVDTNGVRRLVVSDLFAVDSGHRVLPSRFEIRDGSLRYFVDDSNATYPLVVDPLIATLDQRLFPPVSRTDELFGARVALSGDTIIVGASWNSSTTTQPGSAYVFVRTAGSWEWQATLQASAPTAADRFGRSVAIDGDTVVVGAIGSVQAFVRSGASWSPQGGPIAVENAQGIALDGETLLVGAPDSRRAHVYVRDGASWALQQEIAVDVNSFGAYVGVHADTLVVGAPQPVAGMTSDGRAYIYVRADSTWTMQVMLESAELYAAGATAAIEGDSLFVGRPVARRVSVYERTGTTWSARPQLMHADTDFGRSLALRGNTLAIGASTSRGVHIFARGTDGWRYQSTVREDVAFFGNSIALDDGVLVAGAYLVDRTTPSVMRAGTAYAFSVALVDGELGEPCADGSQCLSGFCVDGVCCNSACDDDCSACSAALGASMDGQCGAGHAGRVCREATTSCDAPEMCNGTSTTCPDDVLRAAGFVCRPAAGACDVAEACTGTSASCPDDAFVSAGTECNITEATCALPGVCSGASASCPGGVAPAGVPCRPAVGACDVAETCDGTSDLCPVDALAPNGTVCDNGDGMMCTGVCQSGACSNQPIPGCSTDAGVPDGGVAPDGGMVGGGGGCCRVAGGSSHGGGALALLLGLVAIAAWRGRRRR